MSTHYEPYPAEPNVWLWTPDTWFGRRLRGSHCLPYSLFIELEHGEFGEPDEGPEVYWFPTREKAMAELDRVQKLIRLETPK